MSDILGFQNASPELQLELLNQIFSKNRVAKFKQHVQEWITEAESGDQSVWKFGDLFTIDITKGDGDNKESCDLSLTRKYDASRVWRMTLKKWHILIEQLADFNLDISPAELFVSRCEKSACRQPAQVGHKTCETHRCQVFGCEAPNCTDFGYCGMHKNDNMEKMVQICALCLDADAREDRIACCPSVCTHFYHYRCLQPMLFQPDRKKRKLTIVCPHCRKEWPTKSIVDL